MKVCFSVARISTTLALLLSVAFLVPATALAASYSFTNTTLSAVYSTMNSFTQGIVDASYVVVSTENELVTFNTSFNYFVPANLQEAAASPTVAFADFFGTAANLVLIPFGK